MSVIAAEPKIKKLARGSVRILTENWTAFVKSLGSGISVSSATVESDPSGINFGAVTVSSDITTVTATIPQSQPIGVYQIKYTVTLSSGETEVKSIEISVVEHKNGG